MNPDTDDQAGLPAECDALREIGDYLLRYLMCETRGPFSATHSLTAPTSSHATYRATVYAALPYQAPQDCIIPMLTCLSGGRPQEAHPVERPRFGKHEGIPGRAIAKPRTPIIFATPVKENSAAPGTSKEKKLAEWKKWWTEIGVTEATLTRLQADKYFESVQSTLAIALDAPNNASLVVLVESHLPSREAFGWDHAAPQKQSSGASPTGADLGIVTATVDTLAFLVKMVAPSDPSAAVPTSYRQRKIAGFWRWIKETAQKFLIFAPLAAMVVPVAKWSLEKSLDIAWPLSATATTEISVATAHAFAIFLILVFALNDPETKPNVEAQYPDSVRSLAGRFIERWRMAMALSFVFYLFAVAGVVTKNIPDIVSPQYQSAVQLLIRFAENGLSNASSYVVVLGYLVLAKPRAVEAARPPSTFHWSVIVPVVIFLSEILLFFSPLHQRLGLLPQVATGAYAAWALGLLIGRLDSRLLGVPIRVSALLFLYPAIQPLYVFFDNTAAFLALSAVALVLKIITCLVISWAYSSGAFLSYLHGLRDVDRVSRVGRETFSEVFMSAPRKSATANAPAAGD